jgi:hypothetical protein
MTDLLDGKVVTLSKRCRCNGEQFKIAFANSKQCQIWAKCESCGRSRIISLDSAYKAVRNAAAEPSSPARQQSVVDAIFSK